MGLLDDLLGGVSGRAVPQGNISKPLMLALLAMLASGALSRQGSSGAPAGQPAPAPANNPLGDLLGGLLGGGGRGGGSAPGGALAGGLLGGLGAILGQLQQAGQRDTADSWVGTGQNRQISPGQLGHALSPEVVRELADRSGMSLQDVLSQLSQGLPDLVNQLTPNGRVPSNAGELPLEELSRLSERLR